MSDADVTLHEEAERRLASALRADDPVGALAGTGADPDGVRLAALLVAKLRFERLMNGSELARSWFAKDPQGFAAAFRRYHIDVPPAAFWPSEEGAAFLAWSRAREAAEGVPAP